MRRAVSLPRAVDVLVVGAGHAGLAMSSFLARHGREYVVVDGRDRLGGGWAYEGNEPDGFMDRDEIAARVAQYAEVVHAPVALSTEVRRLTPSAGGGFRVTTSGGELSARQVVVATGSYHTPRVPAWATSISDRVLQLHSHDYRNEAELPEGGVLLVGSGQTGSSWPRSSSRPAGP